MRASLAVLAVLAVVTSAASATPIILEAEDYIDSFNVGGDFITIVECSGASGGLAVEGYDVPGDWIELRVELSQAGDYDDILRSGGELYEASDHFARIRPQGGGTIGFSFYYTYGMGIG